MHRITHRAGESMRRLTYQEILDLANTDLKEAIEEVRINFRLDPQNGDWVGLRAELEGRASK